MSTLHSCHLGLTFPPLLVTKNRRERKWALRGFCISACRCIAVAAVVWVYLFIYFAYRPTDRLTLLLSALLKGMKRRFFLLEFWYKPFAPWDLLRFRQYWKTKQLQWHSIHSRQMDRKKLKHIGQSVVFARWLWNCDFYLTWCIKSDSFGSAASPWLGTKSLILNCMTKCSEL